jgi:hypothetical protein
VRCEGKDGDGDNGHEQDEDEEDVVVMAGDSKREAAGEEYVSWDRSFRGGDIAYRKPLAAPQIMTMRPSQT